MTVEAVSMQIGNIVHSSKRFHKTGRRTDNECIVVHALVAGQYAIAIMDRSKARQLTITGHDLDDLRAGMRELA
jgi:hypothetical protein